MCVCRYIEILSSNIVEFCGDFMKLVKHIGCSTIIVIVVIVKRERMKLKMIPFHRLIV